MNNSVHKLEKESLKMKKENQLGILKMVAHSFRRVDYEVMIIGDSLTNEFTLELSRDFINKTKVSYTADDIIRLSNENDGNFFGAILEDFARINKEQTKERFKNMN